MANGFGFQIDIRGLADMEQQLEGMTEDFERNLSDSMNEYGMLLEEGARSLSHRDGGQLEASIDFYSLTKKGGVMEGSVGSDLKYALKRHEDPYKLGTTRDKYDAGVKETDYYVDGLGRRTRQQPAWRGLKPGRKYVERAVVATEDEFEEILAEALDKTLRGRGR